MELMTILVVLFGLLFGFVFKDLLKEFGADDELADSYIAFLLPPFFAIISFVFIRFFLYFEINFEDLKNINVFMNTPLFAIAVSMLVSGAARFAIDKMRK